MLFVYKDKTDILQINDSPNLLIEVVTALQQIATTFYEDELSYLEKEDLSITVYTTRTNVMFFWLGQEKRYKDLKKYYQMYSNAMIYGDMNLFRMWVKS